MREFWMKKAARHDILGFGAFAECTIALAFQRHSLDAAMSG
jgi:hypothetical protein